MVYRLLKRQGWRELVPRPFHVDADKEKQVAFKKNFLKLLLKNWPLGTQMTTVRFYSLLKTKDALAALVMSGVPGRLWE